jgi:hypothetical protein
MHTRESQYHPPHTHTHTHIQGRLAEDLSLKEVIWYHGLFSVCTVYVVSLRYVFIGIGWAPMCFDIIVLKSFGGGNHVLWLIQVAVWRLFFPGENSQCQGLGCLCYPWLWQPVRKETG